MGQGRNEWMNIKLLGTLCLIVINIIAPPAIGDTCNLIPTYGVTPLKEGALSPFWSQEMVASDLARASVASSHNKALVPIGIVDGGIRLDLFTGKSSASLQRDLRDQAKDMEKSRPEHGTGVANLINGKEPFGSAESAELISISVKRNWFPNETEAIQRMIGKPTRVINFSMGVEEPSSEEPLKTLSQTNILVFAAGNSYPHIVANRIASQVPGIVVGSMRPDGLISALSSEGPGVSIAVPSDFYQLSISKSAEPAFFGHTSGAAAVVTGAVSNVLAILSDITLSEIKALLYHTALNTINRRQKPQRNGPGSLNTLKLVEVAKRLKESGWPQNRERIFLDASLYSFQNEASIALARGKKMLASAECKDQQDGFKSIRTSFFLDENVEARNILASLYEKEGYSLNARFFKNFDDEALETYMKDVATRLLPLNESTPLEESFLAKSVMRNAGLLKKNGSLIIERGYDDLPAVAVLGAADLGKAGMPILKRALSDQNNRDARFALALASIYMPLEMGGVLFLKELASDSDSYVRRQVAVSTASFGSDGMMVLSLLMSEKDGIIRNAIVESAIALAEQHVDPSLLGERRFEFFRNYLTDFPKSEKRALIEKYFLPNYYWGPR